MGLAAGGSANPLSGKLAIHESSCGEEAGAGKSRVICVPRGPPLGHQAFRPGPPRAGKARAPRRGDPTRGSETARLFGSASRAGPGSQTLPPSVNCGHEVIFFPLLIEIICFQFPDKFIEFPLRLGPLGCTVWSWNCGPDPHSFIFLDLHGLQFPETQWKKHCVSYGRWALTAPAPAGMLLKAPF